MMIKNQNPQIKVSGTRLKKAAKGNKFNFKMDSYKIFKQGLQSTIKIAKLVLKK